MSRKLVCTNCGEEFEYNKRGPTPKIPLCLKCKENEQTPWAAKSKKSKKDVAGKVPPPPEKKESKKQPQRLQKFKYYYEFVGPTEKEKPFEEDEKLYAIPAHYYSDERKHTRGRVVKFVGYTDTQGTVLVQATFHVGGKAVEETVTTRVSRLTRFKRQRILLENATEDLMVS